VAAIKTGVANVIDAIDRHIALAEAWASSIDDPEKKKAILDSIQQLKKLKAEIKEAADAVIADPDDAAASQRLNDLLAQARAAINSAIEPHEVLLTLPHLFSLL
jgi:hypothetical protein